MDIPHDIFNGTSLNSLDNNPCICIFSALYAPSTGGVEIFTENLANQLAHMGYRVIIVTSNTHNLAEKEDVNGVLIVRLPCNALMNARLPLPKRNADFKRLMCELKDTQIDAVLINTRFYPHSRIGAELAKQKGVRAILLDHGSAYLTLGNALTDAVLRRYEHHMTNRIKQFDIDFYGISDASVRWLSNFGIKAQGSINNAIDAAKFRESASDRDFRKELGLSENTFLVAYAGRLTPEKGVKELAEAARLLEDVGAGKVSSGKNRDIHFILAGDGFLKDEIRDISTHAHLVGKTSRKDIAALFMQADAFCMPTRSEGFSTSLLEAAVCGCAPVITNVGGVQELIPDESYGVMLRDKQPQTIADAVLSLYENPDRTSAMAEKIQSHAEQNFTWEKTAQAVINATKLS